MNIDFRKLFAGLIVTLILTIPVATALATKNNQLRIEKSNQQQLQIDIKKRDSELQLKQEETKKLKQENEQLQKDLQAKRERQAEEARLAAARQKAAVSNSRIASGGNCEAYRGMVAAYDWDVSTMMRIMKAESGCNPTNHNYGDNHRSCLGSYGLLQVGCVHGYSASYLSNPENNIRVAYNIWKSSGYNAWTTY